MDSIYISPGGIKGYSILGVISVLEKYNIINNFKTYIGSSVGSIICLLTLIGYNSNSIYQLLLNDFENELFKKEINKENILLNLINYYAINNGKKYKLLLEYLLKQKNMDINITFNDLYNKTQKNLIIISSDIKNTELFYFNKDDTPNYSVINSIMASTCIPLIFKPIIYENRILIDGGYFNNLKIKYLTSNTLIINLISDSDYFDISDELNIFEYSKLLVNSLVKSVQKTNNYNNYNNIITLNFNTTGISLKIDNYKRKKLYIYGILKAFEFLKKKKILKKYLIILKNFKNN